MSWNVGIFGTVLRRVALHVSRTASISCVHDPCARPAGTAANLRPQGYFLFLGALSGAKGVDLLLDAFRQIAGEVSAQLVIAGAGEEEATLKTKAVQLGLADRVHFPGVICGAGSIYLLQHCPPPSCVRIPGFRIAAGVRGVAC